MPLNVVPARGLENAQWGCVFCVTGSELATSGLLRMQDGVGDAFAVRQAQHRSVNGRRSEIVKIMLPGYVFFLADPSVNAYWIRRKVGALRLLQNNGQWALHGDDLAFAQWMYAHNGFLEASRAYREGEKVVIAEGPLKELEGVVQKVDRHNRNGLVEIQFDGRAVKVWLPFHYITEERK